jgi:hypothetical protein
MGIKIINDYTNKFLILHYYWIIFYLLDLFLNKKWSKILADYDA